MSVKAKLYIEGGGNKVDYDLLGFQMEAHKSVDRVSGMATGRTQPSILHCKAISKSEQDDSNVARMLYTNAAVKGKVEFMSVSAEGSTVYKTITYESSSVIKLEDHFETISHEPYTLTIEIFVLSIVYGTTGYKWNEIS